MGDETRTKGIKNPYKFLDYYRKNDRQLFFGRERETEILVSDIVTARLVILFAKTGSGKSSLINAGVRPRLEELDYHTFWIRVEQDPAEAALTAFRRENFCLDAKPFVVCVKEIVNELKKPVVLFFDQFEEFFLFPASQESGAVKRFKLAAQHFVSDVGKLYRDRESGVHIVFSMREEFFHEMDVFRSEIPTIFGAESSLRLRWLDDEQARAAITKPALAEGVSFDEKFTSEVIEDLKDSEAASDGVEPARLQIVCDTIWANQCVDLEAYRALGRAPGILASRLERDIANNLTDDELKAFEKLLSELTHSGRHTKRVRVLEEIEQSLKVPPASLDALVGKLEELRLIVKSKHSTGIFIEWTSDYVAGRAKSLKDYVRGTLLERLLRKVRAKAEAQVTTVQKSPHSIDPSLVQRSAEDELETLYMARQDFEAISGDAHLLHSLSADDSRFLLRAALEHGTHLTLWFEKAVSTQVDAWQMLRNRITQEDTQSAQSVHAVNLLGQIGANSEGPTQAKALEFLKLAMEQPDLANDSLEAITKIGSSGAVQLLAEAVTREDLAAKAIAMLRQLRTSSAIRLLAQTAETLGPFSLAAGTALSRIGNDPSLDEANEARHELGALLAKRGADLFRLALEKGIEMQSWLQRAEQVGVPVWSILRSLVSDHTTSQTLRQNVDLLLSQIEDPRAAELRALRRPQGVQTQPISSALKPKSDFSEKVWEIILRGLDTHRGMPIVGPGVSAGILPSMAEVARHLAADFKYPFEDSDNLARVAQYIAVSTDRLLPSEKVSLMLLESQNKSQSSSSAHDILAQLPLPIFLTTSYDTLLVEALKRAGKNPKQAICRWNRHIAEIGNGDLPLESTSAEPLVFHLCGQINHPETLVITEEDCFEFVAAVSENSDLIPSRIRLALSRSPQLFVGVSPLDDAFRLLLRLSHNNTRRGSHVMQVLMPIASQSEAKYFELFLGDKGIKPYFGSSEEFLIELQQRRKLHS